MVSRRGALCAGGALTDPGRRTAEASSPAGPSCAGAPPRRFGRVAPCDASVWWGPAAGWGVRRPSHCRGARPRAHRARRPRARRPVGGRVWVRERTSLDPNLVDVVVDLTRPDVARRTIAWVTDTEGRRHRHEWLTAEDLEAASARSGLRASSSCRTSRSVRSCSGSSRPLPRRTSRASRSSSCTMTRSATRRRARRSRRLARSPRPARRLAKDNVVDPTEHETIPAPRCARRRRGPGRQRPAARAARASRGALRLAWGGPDASPRHVRPASFMGGLVLAVRRIDRVRGSPSGSSSSSTRDPPAR